MITFGKVVSDGQENRRKLVALGLTLGRLKRLEWSACQAKPKHDNSLPVRLSIALEGTLEV